MGVGGGAAKWQAAVERLDTLGVDVFVNGDPALEGAPVELDLVIERPSRPAPDECP